MLKAYCLTNYRSIFDGIAGNENMFCTTINVYNDVLSIFVMGNIGYNNYNVGINYDLKTKKLLSLDEVMNKLSVTDEDLKLAIEQHHNEMKEDSRYCEVEAIDLFNRIKRNSNLDYKIFRSDIDLNKTVDEYAKTFYEDNSNVYTLVGWNEYSVDDHTFAEDLINNQKVCYYINEDNKLTVKNYYKQVETGMLFDNKIVVNKENIEINNGIYGSFQTVLEVEPSKQNEKNSISTIAGVNDFVKLEKINYLKEEDKKDQTLPFIYKIVPKYTKENYKGDFDYKQFRNEFEIALSRVDDTRYENVKTFVLGGEW